MRKVGLKALWLQWWARDWPVERKSRLWDKTYYLPTIWNHPDHWMYSFADPDEINN